MNQTLALPGVADTATVYVNLHRALPTRVRAAIVTALLALMPVAGIGWVGFLVWAAVTLLPAAVLNAAGIGALYLAMRAGFDRDSRQPTKVPRP